MYEILSNYFPLNLLSPIYDRDNAKITSKRMVTLLNFGLCGP